MSSNPARPLEPELLNFLQTLVNGEPDSGQERTDSDKENETGLRTITEEEPTVITPEKPVEVNMPVPPGEDGRGVNVPTNPNEKNGDKVWNDFDAVQNVKNGVTNGVPQKNDDYSDEKFESGDKEEEEDMSRSQVTGDEAEGAKDEDGTISPTQPSKKKKKRLFKRVARPASSTRAGGSHPNLSRPEAERDRHSNRLETMSETSGGSGRRLNKRRQVSRPRCAGPKPEGDALQQKYEELQELIVMPLVDEINGQVSKQQLRRVQGMGQQSAVHNKDSLPPTGSDKRRAFVELNQDNSEQGYSAMRTVQITNQATSANRPRTATHRQRPWSGHQQQSRRRPQSAGYPVANRDSNSANRSRGRGVSRGGKRGNSDRSTSGSVQDSGRSDTNEDDEDGNRSGSLSPGRAMLPSDTHLKNSDNPALRKWLKQKDREIRKQKAEERRKQRQERKEKQEEQRKKDEILKESESKVKEWMTQKKKEARRRAKEERRRQREEEKIMFEKQQRQEFSGSFRAGSMISQSHHDKKIFIPVQRPATVGGETTSQQAATNLSSNQIIEGVLPQPPASKFVYKRPVSGRVRLMKFENERKEDAKRSELQKKQLQKKMAEDKAKKMRMSYDQWLLKKREDDYTKRQEAARQRALAKSDPELERIVPEMARRRIENIQRGKRRVDTGVQELNEIINESFGGADFGNEDTPTLNRLQVSGSHTSLSERPTSAKQALNPRISKSPRRPKSANPRVQHMLDSNGSGNQSETKAFKLPFPPEHGAPRHVAAKQNKLFSPHITQSSSIYTTTETEMPQAAESKDIESQQAEQSQGGADMEEMKTTQQSPDEPMTEEPGKSFFVTDGNLQSTEKSNGAVKPLEIGEREEVHQEEVKDDAHPGNDEEENNTESTFQQENDGAQSASEETVQQESEWVEITPEEIVQQESGVQEPEVTAEEQQGETQEAVEETEDLGQVTEDTLQEDLNLNDKEEPEVQDEEEVNVEEENPLEKSRHHCKRVSFQEEATVYETTDVPEFVEEEEQDVAQDDEEDNCKGNESNETNDGDGDSSEDGNGDGDSSEDGDGDGDSSEDDDEAEDERGDYFDDETPLDDIKS